MTLRETVRALRAEGVAIIPKSEVEDCGTHFLWKNYDPSMELWLTVEGALNAYAGFSDAAYVKSHLKPTVYPRATVDKPMRVVGKFFVPRSEMVCELYINRYGEQHRRLIPVGGDGGRQHDETRVDRVLATRGVIPFGVSGLTARQRYWYMWNRAAYVRSSAMREAFRSRLENSDVSPYRGARRRDTFDVRGDVCLYEANFKLLRDALQAAGRLIAQEDPDPDAFISLLVHVTHWAGGDFARRVRDHWVERVHVGIEYCSCGHWEIDTDVHQLFRGHTACHACYESREDPNDGQVVYLDDVDQYELRDRAYWHEDDEVWRSYAEGERPSVVRGYSEDVRHYFNTDVSIVPSTYGDFLMGIELEVVPNASTTKCAEATNEFCKGYAILKRDGSLDQGGFEIVTAPRGLAEHIKRFRAWSPHSALRAWDTGCCGMHVHLSSPAFTAGTLGKFIEFYNSPENDQFLYAIAGRHPAYNDQAREYCAREGDVPKANPKAMLDCKDTSRYHIINTNNITRREARRLGLSEGHAIGRDQNTIEVRIFRASLKKERLLAQIEFAHASVMFCRWSSMRELTGEHFLRWLHKMAGLYPNLARWYGVRQNKITRDLNGMKVPLIEVQPKARVGADV